MITVDASSIGNIDRKAITVNFDIDAQFTCDVTSQVLVTINGVTVTPDAVVLSTPRTMGILVPNNIKIGDVVEWFYYSGTCKIESVSTNTELAPHATAFAVHNHITSDLILYPLPDYDSFITAADATEAINAYTVNGAEWAALSVQNQEIYLRIALMTIEGGIDLVVNPLPNPLPDCAGEAQALIAVHNVVNQLSAGASATASGEIKKQKVASLEVEYFQSGTVKTATNWIPYTARDCLKLLNYTFASTSDKFKQARVGRM